MDRQKLCPMRIGTREPVSRGVGNPYPAFYPCYGVECAWWNTDHNQCGVVHPPMVELSFEGCVECACTKEEITE